MGKPWYLSKTKLGSVLIGASMILGGIGFYLTGQSDIEGALKAVIGGIGAILIGTGLRDAITNLE